MTVSRNQRAAKRYKVFLRGEVLSGTNRLRAHALDLSQSGAQIAVVETLIPHRNYQFVVRGRGYPMQVIWSRKGRAGVRFRPPLTLETLTALVVENDVPATAAG